MPRIALPIALPLPLPLTLPLPLPVPVPVPLLLPHTLPLTRCLGIVALLVGAFSILTPTAATTAGRLSWLAQQRIERRRLGLGLGLGLGFRVTVRVSFTLTLTLTLTRQLVLAPGALLLVGAAAVMLSHAPRPFAPPLRDVSTDLLEVPRFTTPLDAPYFLPAADTAAADAAAYTAAADDDADTAAYTAADAALIRSGYPDLATISVPGDPATVEA